jgi:hypothetical protein
MNKFSKYRLFLSIYILSVLFISGCKKYDPEKLYTIQFTKDALGSSTGRDTLKVTFSEGYDGKGKVLFSSLDNSAIEILEQGKDYVIINKKTKTGTAGIIAALLNEARINSADTIQFGNSAFKNLIVYEKLNGTKMDLYSINPTTYVQKNLTNTAAVSEHYPCLSVDGSFLSYVVDGSPYDTIYIVQTDGGIYLKKPVAGNVSNLSFTGDGNALCYIVNAVGKVMSIDGNVLNVIFKTSSANAITGAHATYYNGAYITTSCYTDYYYSTPYYYLSKSDISSASYVASGSSSYTSVSNPMLSFDGTQVIYLSGYSGSMALLEYSNQYYYSSSYSSTLISSSSLSNITHPDYNAISSKVVIAAKSSSYSDIYIYDKKTFNTTNITNTPTQDELNPSWN